MTESILAIPCRHMIYDESGYHGCALMPTEIEGKPDHVLCAWFYDVLGTTISFEVSYNDKTGERAIISEYNFPDKIAEKLEKEPHISEVPELCPLGYSYEKIDRKIQPLMRKWEAEEGA